MTLAGRKVILILLPLAMMLITASAHAQSQLISGTVVDQTGAVVPNANVKITDEAKQIVVREVSSDENGRFQALNVQPGSYSITVEAPGFKRLRSQVSLEVNTKLDVGELHLEIGEFNDTVQVVSELSLVQTNTGEKAFSVDARQITALPLNGRNWIALMKTVPGVVSSSPNDFRVDFNDVSGFHANGLRGSQNNFYLDGSPNLDVGDNQSQYTQPSVFSIGEFRVQQSGYNAEYGRSSGVVVAVQTKSGTSGFHGTAYEYVRNDALDARAFGTPPTRSKDVLRYNLFGGNFGGWIPVPKLSTKANKRLFFFYNREMTRRAQPTGPTFLDIPGAQTLVNGDFSPFLRDGIHQPLANMQCAPFVIGTVFRPGTITYGNSGACAGQITGGAPFAGNIVPPALWNSQSANLLKIFTQVPGFSSFPAVSGNPGIVRWATSGSDRLTKNQDLLRIDYTISKSTSTFFRWVNDDQTQSEPFALWGWSSFAGQPPIGAINRPKPGSSWSWNIVKTISPTLVSETILSYNHQSQSLSNSDDSTSRDALGVTFTELFSGTNTNKVIPNFHAYGSNGSPEIRLAWGSPGWHNAGKDYAVTENLSWSKKSHTMKFGFYYNRDDKQQTSNFGAAQGDINFDSNPNNPGDTGSGLANLLLGSIGQADSGAGQGYGQANASVFPYFRFESLEGYAQDSWKVNKRLTLEVGVRFQHTTPTYTVTRDGTPGGEGTFLLYSLDLTRYSAASAPQINLANGQVVGDTLSQYLANGLVCDPCNGVPRGFAPARNFLSPRAAFAYDLFGDGKTAIRGGFGQYVERLRQNNFNFDGGSNFPNGGGASIRNTNVNNITPGVVGLPVGPRNPQAYRIFPKGNTMPTIYSWNIGVQRELVHNLGLDVSYIGNRSIHLMLQRQINGLPAGYFLANPNARASVNNFTDALRPYRGFGAINSIETSGYADYHGLLARLSRRFSKGLQFNVNYTLSRARDLVDNDSDNVHNPFNVRADFAPAGYDATHNFTIDYVYELPTYKGEHAVARGLLNGWEVSGITHFQSGFPLNIQGSGDLFGLDAGVIYPDLVGDPYAGQTEGRWLNPSAFRSPQNGERGNLGRNALRGPGYTNFDVALSRTIRAGERVNFKISADAFNVFNHPQVFSINTGFGADTPGSGPNSGTIANMGTIQAFRDARTLQFGFRLQF